MSKRTLVIVLAIQAHFAAGECPGAAGSPGSRAPAGAVAVVALMLMNRIVLTDLTYQAIHKRLVLGWETWSIMAVYLVAAFRLSASP